MEQNSEILEKLTVAHLDTKHEYKSMQNQLESREIELAGNGIKQF
jgi:hypothetical protein